ncbi:MAG: DUF262 domain-containing protein [Trebonia sp.]
MDVVEETFQNIPTGVEVELNDDTPEEPNPWNPDAIRVSTKTFSLRNILDLIDDKDLELAPDFQRNRVWKSRQKSRLIESILLQIPLPAFYFAEDSNGMMRVIDGLQRLSTVYDFVRQKAYVLTDLEYLDSVKGQRFDQLPAAMQRRINNAQIVVHVIDPTTPAGVKYDIFKRINTGGSPLTGQEIRHCMSSARSRDFLRRCAQAKEFELATNGNLVNHIRMDDREVVLRYCAFRHLGVDGYADAGSIDAFLEKMTAQLDSPEVISDPALDVLFRDFRAAMMKSRAVFGVHAFRKWPKGVDGRWPINRPLFETWSYVLSEFSEESLIARKEAIVEAARNLMTNDREYIDAITAGTGSVAKVKLRFERTALAAQAGL